MVKRKNLITELLLKETACSHNYSKANDDAMDLYKHVKPIISCTIAAKELGKVNSLYDQLQNFTDEPYPATTENTRCSSSIQRRQQDMRCTKKGQGSFIVFQLHCFSNH